MAKVTIRTKLLEQLAANGHSEIHPVHPRSTPKYVKFDIPGLDSMPETFLFVGKAGALRSGHCSSESVVADNTKARLLAQWDTAHPKRGAK